MAVQVLMVVHVLHWWLGGRSLGRFVLSDSMLTLEQGEINPGFLLFALALLSTALVGRFLCGWICHIGALQDLSAWALRKLGVRPRLFRSRLLGFVPIALALYMFCWPTFQRELLVPLFPWAAAGLDVRPFPGFSLALWSDRLWEGLPSLWLAVPFLLVCGFLIVLFLGARGLCRYACPYGGVLFPAEKLARGRVVADMNRCDQCGLCTAACTAGVRVHDEIRERGSVVDRNCIRSLDCVGACPQQALRFSVRAAAPVARNEVAAVPTPGYDLSWPEEFGCLVVFVAVFFTLRGLYESIPLLMAAPLAVLVAYLGWKACRLLQDPNVELARLQLRLWSRLTGAGRVFLVLMALLTVLLLHSAVVRASIWRGRQLDARVRASFQAALAQQGISDSDRENAEAALELYRLSNSCWRSEQRGIGLAFTPKVSVRISWLEFVRGQTSAAIEELDALRKSGRAGDGPIADLGSMLRQQGELDRARSVLTETLVLQPGFVQCRDLLASMHLEAGRSAEAEGIYRERLASRPTDSFARVGLARTLFPLGRQSEALALLEEASLSAPREPAVARAHALALHALGRHDDSVAELRRGARARPAARIELLQLAAHVLRQAGREVEALRLDQEARP